MLRDEVEITYHRDDLQEKTLIGRYDFIVDKIGEESDIEMNRRAQDSAIHKAKETEGSMIYINGRRWRYLEGRLMVITNIYKINRSGFYSFV